MFQAPPPCREDPEVFFSPDLADVAGQAMNSPGDFNTEARQAMAEFKRTSRERELKAQLICLTRCPLARREECLAQGMDEEWGVWGGYSVSDRRALRAGVDPYDGYLVSSKKGIRRKQYVQELLSGSTVDEIAEMHGSKRESVLTQLGHEVAVLSGARARMRVRTAA